MLRAQACCRLRHDTRRAPACVEAGVPSCLRLLTASEDWQSMIVSPRLISSASPAHLQCTLRRLARRHLRLTAARGRSFLRAPGAPAAACGWAGPASRAAGGCFGEA
eukprot:scaffold635_cov311-Pinguiococcus_pyrenoidosus.AAC.3